ncbi:MAG: nucleotidyl transferase AbiEii/AbiGii toxin family protein [Actinobacteria bacterium]|nr:nucleotidyl transferase AbiEii/AbiGii toxin family protein [Actinomycetota bacterium]
MADDVVLPLWRDVDQAAFDQAVIDVAARLDVLPLAVEKDYWVCRALRAITTGFPGEVVFKGGTSLEKLRIIQRFSEDLDLLVIGDYGSGRAAERALKTMLLTAAVETGAEPTDTRSGGKPGNFHRAGYLAPALQQHTSSGAVADASAILVELGQSGGPNPHSARSVTSLLGRELATASGFDPQAWADLAAFDAEILHPGRTLVEKLLRVNNFAADPDAIEGSHGWSRIGRQFYDIHALLGTQEVLDLLADHDAVGEILDSAFAVSESLGRPDRPVPDGGFAAMPVFDPAWSYATQLRAEHDAAMRDLYYGKDEPPTFDAVIKRVHEHAALLALE